MTVVEVSEAILQVMKQGDDPVKDFEQRIWEHILFSEDERCDFWDICNLLGDTGDMVYTAVSNLLRRGQIKGPNPLDKNNQFHHKLIYTL